MSRESSRIQSPQPGGSAAMALFGTSGGLRQPVEPGGVAVARRRPPKSPTAADAATRRVVRAGSNVHSDVLRQHSAGSSRPPLTPGGTPRTPDFARRPGTGVDDLESLRSSLDEFVAPTPPSGRGTGHQEPRSKTTEGHGRRRRKGHPVRKGVHQRVVTIHGRRYVL